MKTNKLFIFAFACLTLTSAGSAFAQVSKTNISALKTAGSKGFVTGLVYSNISDSKMTTEYQTYWNGAKSQDSNETNYSGVHLGLMGLHLGYKDIYAFGTWGVSTGVQWLRGLNGSESPSKLNIYKVLGDVVLPVSDHLALSAGLNASYFDGLNENSVTVQPGLGAQIGAEIRFNEVGFLLGAQLLSLNSKFSDSDSYGGNTFKSEGKMSALFSGVITQLSYTF